MGLTIQTGDHRSAKVLYRRYLPYFVCRIYALALNGSAPGRRVQEAGVLREEPTMTESAFVGDYDA